MEKQVEKLRGKEAGICNRPVPSILLTNVQSLDNKLDQVRA